MSDAQSNELRRLQENEIDLRGVFNLLKANYRIILFTALAFLMCGIYYASIQPPVYRSTALIQVQSSDMSSMLGGGKTTPTALLGQTSQGSVEADLLSTPYILGDVVAQMRFDIAIRPKKTGFFSNKNAHSSANIDLLSVPDILLGKKLTLIVLSNDRYQLLSPSKKIILTGRVGRLAQSLYLGEPLKIKVGYLKGTPGSELIVTKASAMNVAYSLANHFFVRQDGTADYGSGNGILRLTFDASTPGEAQRVLNKILDVAVFRDTEQKEIAANRMLNFLDGQLPILNSELNESENKINAFGVKTGIFSIKSSEEMLNANLLSLQKTLKKLQVQKINLLENFTSRHPLVIAATQEEMQIKKQIAKAKIALDKLPFTAEKEGSLLRNFKVQETIYANMMSSIEQMQMMKAGILSNVRVLDSANYPIAPLSAKKRMIILSSLVMGLLVGISIVFIKHVLLPVIDDPEVIERKLDTAIAGILAFSQRQFEYEKIQKRNKILQKPFLLSREFPRELAVEGIRSLRTFVQMMLLEAKNNVVSITGCSPSAGKSFISANFAVLFSDINKRVLLIDADIRKGKLYQSFGAKKNPGLSDFLQQKISLDKAIQPLIKDKLDFISTGEFPDNPSELLSEGKFRQAIEILQSEYDLIVIDTPPVLAVTDASLILKNSSINLLVVSVGRDHLAETEHTKKILEKNGIALSGLIFNITEQQKLGATHAYGKYNYYYDYEKTTV